MKCKAFIPDTEDEVHCKANALKGEKYCWRHMPNYRVKKLKKAFKKARDKSSEPNQSKYIKRLLPSPATSLALSLESVIRHIIREELTTIFLRGQK